jgi:hypothetical protein
VICQAEQGWPGLKLRRISLELAKFHLGPSPKVRQDRHVYSTRPIKNLNSSVRSDMWWRGVIPVR